MQARQLTISASVGVFMVGALTSLCSQTADPRVAELQALATQIGHARDSQPALAPSVRDLLTHAVVDLTTAASSIPPIPLPPPPPTPGTGTCGESIVAWHPAVVNGCETGHEHGDAPPTWATNFSQTEFGHGVVYGGDEASSAAENGMKHQAFKGVVATTAAGGEVYLRYHAASNPMDRSARYHSYEVYYRDTAGHVSFWQGWYNSGDPNGTGRCVRRVPMGACENVRPVILVTDDTSFAQGATFEQWYVHAAGQWSWDIGIGIGSSTTYYRAGENATAHDTSTWLLTGSKGLTRRMDGFWYTGRAGGGTTLVGNFCATALGVVVNCMAPGALAQRIAPTLAQDARVQFGVSQIGFLVQRSYAGPGVVVPN